MKPITKEQLICLNTLVSKQGISKDDKAFLVSSFSRYRVTSSKDLFFDEAKEMIRHLKENDPNEKMRKKVFALAYCADIIYGDTPADKKMNAIKLNQFLKAKGAVKKELSAMSRAELVKVVSQFEQIIKHTAQTTANKATKSLLEELSIPVEKKSQESH